MRLHFPKILYEASILITDERQFLDCHGFVRTIKELREEAASSGFSVSEKDNRFTKDRVKRADALKLFEGLESSDYNSFFKVIDWKIKLILSMSY